MTKGTLKKGSDVWVDRCFFVEYFPHGSVPVAYRVPCIVVKDDPVECARKTCRSSCVWVARWVRKVEDQKDWERLHAKGFRGASWNFNAYKVCTAYLHGAPA